MRVVKTVLLTAILGFNIFLVGCNDDEQQQDESNELQLSFNINPNGNGRIEEDFNPSEILVSIVDENQVLVIDRELFGVNAFGNSFLVNPILLEIGAYQITEFLVLNEDGEIILATPTENSILASLVENPLPVGFQITSDDVSEVALEVISTEGVDPENLGYASLSFNIIPTIDILVSTFSVNETNTGFSLVASSLLVDGDGDSLFTVNLGDSINVVKLRTDIEVYNFTASLENGSSESVTLTNEELNTDHTQFMGICYF